MAVYPCGDCNKRCTTFVIACDTCNRWFHIKCQRLSKEQFQTLGKYPDISYHCIQCTSNNGVYDFAASLRRLGQYAQSGVLKDGVEVEKTILRLELNKPVQRNIVNSKSLRTDTASSMLLNSTGTNITSKTAVYTTGDGNCLFNAVSLALSGGEQMAT